jgi:hypothetical protein
MRIVLRGAAIATVLALAIAGCGAGTEREGAKATGGEATVSKQEERELARGKELNEKAEARTVAEEQHEQKQQEAHERAEHEERENSPESHHYPASVRAGFLHGCEATSGHEDSACECAIKRIEAKVPLGRYRQNEAEVREGKPPAFIYNFEYGYCEGSEAISG